MSDLSDIRDGIKTTLEAANPGIRVYKEDPDGPLTYPCVVIGATPTQEHDDGAMAGNSLIGQDWPLTLHIRTSSRVEASRERDKYMSPTGTESIRAGIQSDRSLDSKVDDSYMPRCDVVERDEEDESAGSQIYMAEFTVWVLKTIA